MRSIKQVVQSDCFRLAFIIYKGPGVGRAERGGLASVRDQLGLIRLLDQTAALSGYASIAAEVLFNIMRAQGSSFVMGGGGCFVQSVSLCHAVTSTSSIETPPPPLGL